MKRAKRFKMNRYGWSEIKPQKWISISKIVVKTKEDKEQLLLASEYIHGLSDIDTDYMGANVLAHLYRQPELIEVEEDK
jgi:hypothetical protein